MWMVMLIVGCASAPPERFYTLSPGAAVAAGEVDRSVVVSATLPELVDRPQLVVRTGPQQVAILEQQRWAEPLRAGVPRVVAENLGRRLGTRQVSTSDLVITNPDCRVHLDLRRFDAQPGVAVEVEALWSVSCAGAGKRTGQSAVREPVAGAAYEELVAAQSRALESVSGDVARALQEGRRNTREP
jgi:uncharacterized lipoprotein YmbA